jgi:hypothetical protein
MSFQVCSADVALLIPSHHLTHRRHIVIDSSSQQKKKKNVIRTKFKMINIYNGKMEELVSALTKVICKDYNIFKPCANYYSMCLCDRTNFVLNTPIILISYYGNSQFNLMG